MDQDSTTFPECMRSSKLSYQYLQNIIKDEIQKIHCPWLLADRGCVAAQGESQDKDKPPAALLMGAITPHTLTSVQSLTALIVAVSHTNVSKAGGTNKPQVFDQHRGTERNGKFLLTYQDAKNHATIEKLRGKLQK